MFLYDLRRTFGAWRAQPLLPLSVLAIAALLALSESVEGPVVLLAIPLFLFYVGFLGTQRAWYVRAWKGGSLGPREAFSLSLGYFWPYVALGVFALLIVLPLLLLGGGGTPARVAAVLVVDVVLTFATSALAVDRMDTDDAVSTGWRMLRSGWPACAPHVLLPPLVLYPLADRNGWLFLVAETVALVARGVTTSYYVRTTVRQRPPGEDAEQPGLAFQR